MNPLIDNFRQNLKPCSGCGKDLSDPEFDQFWKPKEENAIHSQQTDSDRRGESGGSDTENQAN